MGAMKQWSSMVMYAVMYTLDWILVPSPIVVSFSTTLPRPTTTLSPSVQRSRTPAWSPMMQPAPSVVPR